MRAIRRFFARRTTLLKVRVPTTPPAIPAGALLTEGGATLTTEGGAALTVE